MTHWLYRRVPAVYYRGKIKREGVIWKPTEDILMESTAKKWGVLNPNTSEGWPAYTAEWLAWDEDFEYLDRLDDVLKGLGEHGWELVAVHKVFDGAYYVLKRPYDYEIAALLEKRLAVADSEPTYSQQEVEEHIRQWRG